MWQLVLWLFCDWIVFLTLPKNVPAPPLSLCCPHHYPSQIVLFIHTAGGTLSFTNNQLPVHSCALCLLVGSIFNINEALADPSLTLTCSAAHCTSERKGERPRSCLTAHRRVRAGDTPPHPCVRVSCKPCMSEHHSPCGMMCNIWICTCLIHSLRSQPSSVTMATSTVLSGMPLLQRLYRHSRITQMHGLKGHTESVWL